MLLATFWKGQKQRRKYFNGKKNGISNLEEQSMKSEFGHLIPFIIICFLCLYLIVIGQSKLAVFTLLINFVGNLYPIILQRHHRMRIEIIRKSVVYMFNNKSWEPRPTYIYIYIYIYIYDGSRLTGRNRRIYIYIYIERERERERMVFRTMF